jgi:hypothetical protein
MAQADMLDNDTEKPLPSTVLHCGQTYAFQSKQATGHMDRFVHM